MNPLRIIACFAMNFLLPAICGTVIVAMMMAWSGGETWRQQLAGSVFLGVTMSIYALFVLSGGAVVHAVLMTAISAYPLVRGPGVVWTVAFVSGAIAFPSWLVFTRGPFHQFPAKMAVPYGTASLLVAATVFWLLDERRSRNPGVR